MRVAEVMTTGVKTVRPETSAADAWESMRRQGIHHLVVMRGSTVAGVLSDRDMSGQDGGRLRAAFSVEDLMTNAVVTVEPRDTIRTVANRMRGRTLGCVPVVEGPRLKGIVTVSDLLQLLGRGVDRPSKPRRHDVHVRVPHRHRRNAAAAS
jgi:acetoin utilization protein AcuB